jgi:GT2 family glycosyltransferase/glycosyltransferase involved in cell wall biosynthesis
MNTTDSTAAAPAKTPAQDPPANEAGILFDQYSRYACCAELVRQVLPKGGTVLDVGSGFFRLLGKFLGDDIRVTYIDPALANVHEPNCIGQEFDAVDFADGSFDVVVSVDALEHMPPETRDAFLDRIRRVARNAVVLGAPFGIGGDAADTDEFVSRIYQRKTGSAYPWLKEHQQFSLPDLARTGARLATGDWDVATFGQGHVPWLRELLPLHVLLLDDRVHRPFLKQLGNEFARLLYRFDRRPPSYRHFVVATAPKTPAPVLGDPGSRADAERAWSEFRESMFVLLSEHLDKNIETARNDWTRQLARLKAEIEQLSLEADRDNAALEALRLEHEVLQAQYAAIHGSLIWRLTAPVRKVLDVTRRGLWRVRHGLLGGLARLVRAFRMPASIEWALKATFFKVFGWMLRGTRQMKEFEDARRLRHATNDENAFVIPRPTEPDDLIVFGIIDWAFRIQRPQHLTRELAARGHRTYYFGPNFIRTAKPGYRVTRVHGSPDVFEVQLHAPTGVRIYDGGFSGRALTQLVASLRIFLADVGQRTARVIVDHPGWWPLARLVPRSVSVYDCMDNHHGFAESGSALVEDELAMLREVDHVVVTSDWLDKEVQGKHPRVVKIRNGCSPADFLSLRLNQGARTIGYFGAIAEWFDVELVGSIARRFPTHRVLLVGNDTVNAKGKLGRIRNVEMIGEIPYSELPKYIEKMDVCLIPFRIDDLTRATNPVKAYEGLAAGRPVVATPMPEVESADFENAVFVAERGPAFLDAVERALAVARDPERVEKRRAIARRHSWAARAKALDQVFEHDRGEVFSLVIVTWNGAELTRRCLDSILQDPGRPAVEIVVVDNASTDRTAELLDRYEADFPGTVRSIRNADNRGFGAAVNQGLADAKGDVLVVLNNDIVVTPGWLRTIGKHLRNDHSIGMIGPVTNNIGNEALIPTSYRTMADMQQEQTRYTAAHAGHFFDIRVTALFCAAVRRDVYAKIGGLDEGFGRGFFEDDDYAERVRQAGWRVVCAEDVFVHHELSASFNKVKSDQRQRLFEENKAYYESKWGPWQPHVYRPEVQNASAATPAETR